jgi:hypothetical protein
MTDSTQTVVDEPKTSETATEETQKPVKPEAEGTNAPDERSLDDILNEFESNTEQPKEEGKKGEAKPQKPSSEDQAFIAEMRARIFNEDFQKAVKTVKGDLDIPDEFVDVYVQGMASKDKRVALAWANRYTEPEKYNQVLRGLGKQLASTFNPSVKVDSQATSAREAVVAAVRNSSTRQPDAEINEKELGKMPEHEFHRLVQTLPP